MRIELRMVLVIGTVLGISLMWGSIEVPSVFAQELGGPGENLSEGAAENATYGNMTSPDMSAADQMAALPPSPDAGGGLTP